VPQTGQGRACADIATAIACQPGEEECPYYREEDVGAVAASLVLNADYSTLAILGTPERDSFESSFRRDVAAMLGAITNGGISEDRVVIKSMAAGSTVVDFLVLPPAADESSSEEEQEQETALAVLLATAFSTSGVSIAGTETAAAIEPGDIIIVTQQLVQEERPESEPEPEPELECEPNDMVCTVFCQHRPNELACYRNWLTVVLVCSVGLLAVVLALLICRVRPPPGHGTGGAGGGSSKEAADSPTHSYSKLIKLEEVESPGTSGASGTAAAAAVAAVGRNSKKAGDENEELRRLTEVVDESEEHGQGVGRNSEVGDQTPATLNLSPSPWSAGHQAQPDRDLEAGASSPGSTGSARSLSPAALERAAQARAAAEDARMMAAELTRKQHSLEAKHEDAQRLVDLAKRDREFKTIQSVASKAAVKTANAIRPAIVKTYTSEQRERLGTDAFGRGSEFSRREVLEVESPHGPEELGYLSPASTASTGSALVVSGPE